MNSIPPIASVIYRLLRRVLTLDVAWLMLLDRPSEEPPSEADESGVAVRFLSPSEIEGFASCEENQLSAKLADRLRGGDFCVGAFVDGELASYAWYALQSIEPEQNRGSHRASGVGFSFPPNMAFMYNGYTLSKFRGRGLYRKIQQAAFALLEGHGVTTILSTADWSNAAALKSCNRLGFRPIGRVWVGGLGDRVWRKRPAAASKYGIAGLDA